MVQGVFAPVDFRATGSVRKVLINMHYVRTMIKSSSAIIWDIFEDVCEYVLD